jgi:hypothetical protein
MQTSSVHRATTQGTNTKKMAVPMTAEVLGIDTIRSLLF